MIIDFFTGCTGGLGSGQLLSNGIGSGGGYGGTGGYGCYDGTCIEGGLPYGDADLPCQLGSGGGNDSTAGGGILGMCKSSNQTVFSFAFLLWRNSQCCVQ